METVLLSFLFTLALVGLEIIDRLVRTRYWDLRVAVVWLVAMLVLMQYQAMGHEISLAIQVPMVLTFIAFCGMVLADRLRRYKSGTSNPYRPGTY